VIHRLRQRSRRLLTGTSSQRNNGSE
jgi:hypothetical protein